MERFQNGSQQEAIDHKYIALKDVRDQFKKGEPSPYQTKFSLAVLIEALKDSAKAFPNSFLSGTIETKLLDKDQSWEALYQDEDFEYLMRHLFPAFFLEKQMGFIKSPFENYQFRFQTKALKALISDDRWELKIDQHHFTEVDTQNTLMAGMIVLNRFYGQKKLVDVGVGMTLRDRETGIERYYRFDIHLDYLEVKLLKPLKPLSEKQIHELYNHPRDTQLWLEYLPPDNFRFEGFVVGFIADVTKAEILSLMKEIAVNEGGKKNHHDDLNRLETLAKSYLNIPSLQLGALQAVYAPLIDNITWSLLRRYDESIVVPSLADQESLYGRVLHEDQSIFVDDLRAQKRLSPLEEELVKQGIRSLLLAPLKNNEGEIISIFELASPKPYQFSQLTLLQLDEFIMLFEMGTNKFMQAVENSIRLTIQQEFTSIHPSVEWKFKNVASKYYWKQLIEKQQSNPGSVVFKDVYPLYGQADIVGSSKLRNSSIQDDLIENLENLYQLLVECRKSIHFHLLDIYLEKVSSHLERLKAGAFVSSDESLIVELLTEEIHPLLRKLRMRFQQMPDDTLDRYFELLDPELDIIYKSRKAYEDSVGLVNQHISSILQEEEEKMQEVLPHYFEKFQTDGVEYNLYVGQSLLEEATYESFYLRDFRLWQLILMCKITRLVEEKTTTFPVPLNTAQLVFVYSNSLSIRFQMDEKQFDVDGAYNVRYEILKKRIDKAYIKGTDERLTQPGKIAIVWLQEKDRKEYQEYLDHLVRNGYIDPEIEDVDLERMQGVEGLKAIRITVIPESATN